ncbi:MAG: PLP-dependent transferase [candidate division KSB1 bacterium]|nr:PLP-dependent transferase [candidate division KSB1 bacterium]
MKGFTTKALHAQLPKRDPHGSLRIPVYDSVAFEFDSAQDIQLAFEGQKLAHTYSRISNPTVEDFENRVRVLADAYGVLAVSSGMAAISNVILTLAGAGTNIVAGRFLFGNTVSLFNRTLKPWGLTVRYVDVTNPATVEQAIDANTRAVFVEAITNPQLEVPDIEAIAAIARKHSVPLIVDGTLTTPYLFRSKDFGAAVEVISSTKHISGGATSVGGLIIDNGTFDWSLAPALSEAFRRYGPSAFLMRLRREVYRNLGACLSPHNAYLQTLGLETLALRIERSCQNALELAHFLRQHPKVRSVNYPGLPDSPYHAIARKQFRGRYGALLTFELESQEACFRLIDSLRIVRRATNLNDNKTLIIHPFSTIVCEYSPEERRAMGISERMLRLAVGIEDIEDLIDDLSQALQSV